MIDVVVIGAGPAGVLAAIRAAELGARTALVTSAESGGMAAAMDQWRSRTLAYRRPLDPRRPYELPRCGDHPDVCLRCTTIGCWSACAEVIDDAAHAGGGTRQLRVKSSRL